MQVSKLIRKLAADNALDPTPAAILPGGGIDGESPESAAKRELREEISGKSLKKFKTVKHKGEGFILHVYITDSYRGNAHLDENDRYEWVGLEDLGKYRFVPTVKKILQEALG